MKYYNNIPGYMTANELLWLYNAIKSLQVQNPIIVELGGYKGRSTNVIAHSAKIKNGMVYTVDNFTGVGVNCRKEFIKNTRNFKNVKLIEMSSVEAAKKFQDNSVDFLFIDDDHSFNNVIAVNKAWLPKMKSTGIMCGHDYGKTKFGVTEAVKKMYSSIKRGAGSIWVRSA